jgi:hypothetical protein
MIIASSKISLASQHSLVEQESQQESLKIWKNGAQYSLTNNLTLAKRQDELSISTEAQELLTTQTQGGQSLASTQATNSFGLSDSDKQKITLIERMIEMLTGKKFKLRVFDSSSWANKQIHIGSAQRPNGGLSYDLHQTRFEEEKTAMQASGVVKTADGRQINFAMNVSMSRQFASKLDLSVRAGAQPVDPLVINLSGAPGALTAKKYSFDIDSDGDAEQISFAGSGSGFLALDRNNDGKINDGSELFGPESGNGFADLAKFDGDGNNWIDENDPIFDKLRIWMKDESGKDQLVALGQAGVGAIYLGNVSTEFAVKDAANSQQGQIRTSGMFLRENGTAGVVQQIDLAV